jgi:branched-chain amino acid aminotransferase
MKAWLNGDFVDWSDTDVPLLSHSFSRGSAIFEVVDIVPSKTGPAFFGLQEHIDRFFNSARLTYMDLPIKRDELINAVVETAKMNQVAAGTAKFYAYYPHIEMRTVPTNPEVHITIFAIDFKTFGISQDDLSAPVSVGISSFRKIHPETVPPHAKIVGNYANAFLATMEVMKKGYEDAILLDTMGFVAEGPTSNVFFVTGDRVLTPYLRNALPGITRTAAMEALADMKFEVQEKDIRAGEVEAFDEAFFSSSVLKIHPIRSIDGHALGNTCPGPVTCRLMDKMGEIFEGENELFKKWLTFV